jgi:hypothetical protein
MRKIGNLLYWLAFAVGATFLVGSTFPDPLTGPSSGLHALSAFGAAFLLSTFEKGNKTALQKIFLAAFGLFATGAIAYSLGWIGWVGACVSMFMVATMKLDGGDSNAG